jgi:hypothetical protein
MHMSTATQEQFLVSVIAATKEKPAQLTKEKANKKRDELIQQEEDVFRIEF